MKDNIEWIIDALKTSKLETNNILRAKGAYKMPNNLKEAIKSGIMRAKINKNGK